MVKRKRRSGVRASNGVLYANLRFATEFLLARTARIFVRFATENRKNSRHVDCSGELRLGEQRRFAVRGKCVRASNGIPPFREIAFGQATAFCRSRKMYLDEQRHSAVQGKCIWTNNGISPFEENASGQAPAFRRLKNMRRDEQRRFAVRGKRVKANNGILLFNEIAAEYEVRTKVR